MKSDNPHQLCPICASVNVIFSKKRGVSVCEDCGHEFVQDEQIAPLRIFLSYGHDANEDLVRRIKVDLQERGHDVWFDKSEIKFGDDWRREITDGILRSNRVLSFLSKYSTRDPGVCRDEIAIAIGVKGGNIQTILIEGEGEVQPPVNIGHIQWLDMHDWKERFAAGEEAWEEWYQVKLAEIIRVVESDESRRFAGEIESLSGHLKPIRSEARVFQLLNKGFYGRQWLFDAVEDWRKDTAHGSRVFWIMGAPGVGKSALAAQLTHRHGDRVIAAQFCEWDKPDHRSAERVVRSLAFQLATRLPDYRRLLLTLPEISQLDGKNATELFDYLLANPLQTAIQGGRERYLILIDALDEAGESGRNPLVEMLAGNAQRLPDWLGFVVTSRPEFDVKTPLQALNPIPLDTESESNRADIRDYLRRELAAHLQSRSDADCLVEQILEKSEGVFLYVERFCDDIRCGHNLLDHPEQFPQGLGGIFYQYFQRKFPDIERYRKDVRPALRAILAAREALPVEILQRLFNWQEEESHDFTRPLASLFPIASENGCQVIKPYHKSLADWLADQAMAGSYFVSVLEGHRLLADQLREFIDEPGHAGNFARSSLPLHLALRQAIWRKGDSRWVVCGIPDVLYTDNGSDFTSRHLEQVGANLKIRLVFSIPGRPRGRGRIERFFSTVNEMFLCELQGYAPPGGKVRGKPTLTLEELDAGFRKFLLDTYHRREHSETKQRPVERWEAGGFLPRMPESLEQLDLLLIRVARSRHFRADGIYFQSLRYISTTLAAYVGETVTLRYDPRDMGEVRVFHEEKFLCRAVCAELAGETVPLREIITARNRRRRELRSVLKDRQKTVDTLLELKCGEVKEKPDEPPNPTAKQLPKRATPELKRYRNE